MTERNENPVDRYVRTQGDYCAHTVITTTQVVILFAVLLSLALVFYLSPVLSFYMVLLLGSLLGVGIICSRLFVYAIGLKRCHNKAQLAIDDASLPIYSVLVPLYREQEIIPHLVESLSQLDYPQDKLDIQLLVEEEDVETRNAITELDLPLFIMVTVVEDGTPRTKPRACDYGLELAKGEYVVIFDAEDRPEKDQLRKAVAEFEALPKQVSCLQARLSHYNCQEALTARWTDLDYLLWYSVSMNGLQRLGIPMPLGGTSNHFKTDVLRAVGGWDPFNVTEDCDLGLRLIRAGKHIRMLDSCTWEEAVTGVGSWIKQRSRWIKGFMQTALVHTRKRSLREFGLYKFLCMLLFVPGSVMVQLAAPLLFLSPFMLILQAPDAHNRFQGSMWQFFQEHTFWEIIHNDAFMSSLLFLLGLLGVLIGLMVLAVHFLLVLVRGRRDLFLTAFSIPFAWICLACAAWRALAELIFKPFYWAKTSHGHVDLSPIHQRIRIIGARLALAVAVGVVTYGAFAYVTRLSLIIHTWGDPRHQESQDLSPLQQLGIVNEVPCRAKEKAKFSLQKWDILPPENTTWRAYDGVSALVSIPETERESRQLLWKVRLDDGYWFTYLDPFRIEPGRFTRLELDLRPYAQGLIPQGHQRTWDDYVLHDVEEIRLVDYSQKDQAETEVVQVQMQQIMAFSLSKKAQEEDNIEIIASPELSGNALDCFEWNFVINKIYENPYDSDEVSVDAVFTHQETGRQIKHPAFFMIPYQRSKEQGREVLSPIGSATWCLRWAAPSAGKWTGEIKVFEQDQVVATQKLQTLDISAAQHSGYIQRHASKPYLQHSNGDFFYPIGHNVCWPVDTKKAYDYDFELPVDAGSFLYDDYFKRMAAGKENWVRIWMAYTWIGLEGLKDWRHFDGLGYYNQANAARLDHLLKVARKHGIYMRLTMQHYSDFSRRWGNSNWNTNPYTQRWGGPLRYSGEFLTNREARNYQKKRLRYIIARWGWDPHVESWELWGEVNLLDNFTQKNAIAWHREMIDHIHSLDSTKRPIFSHCHNWQLGMQLWPTKGLDCVQGNGYIRPPNHTPNHIHNFTGYLHEVAHFKKPVFMAEYGGRSELGAPNKDYLEAQLHSGLWAGAVHPFAGSAFSWWWNFIDGENLYFHYAALHDFLAGIDRIARDLKTVKPSVMPQNKLQAHGLQDKDGGIYWIYHPETFLTCNLDKVAGAKIMVPSLPNAQYRVRLMNTWTGKWIFDKEIAINNRRLDLDLPPVHRDMALRIDRLPPD